jgi:hypothetical protein
MSHIKCAGFILMLLMLNKDAAAQSAADSLRSANKNTKIALADITGDWYAADSLQSKISFNSNGRYDVCIEGIKHGVGKYHFIIDGDSIYVNGTAANWPPYCCTLMLLSNHVLEIKFWQYAYKETRNMLYRRKQN